MNAQPWSQVLEWFPAIISTGLFGAVLWLARNLIFTRLTSSVRHEYDVRLKELEQTQRIADEYLKFEIRKNEVELDTLRCGALSGITTRQAELYKRQLRAVETIWSCITKLSKKKGVIQSISIIKFEVAAKEASQNIELREKFKAMGAGLDIESLATEDADACRPFLSPLVWAYFSAYRAIFYYYFMKQKFLESGLKNTDLIQHHHVKKLIEVALPHQATTLERFGTDNLYLYFDELEKNLLHELNKIILGEKNNQESLKQASAILKTSEELKAKAIV